jgi:hypothetical protein|uniref:Uncharacterized protein n=1 Tax=Picea sitchensis TaxID=3332 RepID=A0A6B9XPX0_PICSI|nr:hypothetical protein Q903MT_gene4037 [Picea sitchensis]QHR90745.1 hypothetical protein Q903MT_gene4771 [Picea sitchensis]
MALCYAGAHVTGPLGGVLVLNAFLVLALVKDTSYICECRVEHRSVTFG